MAAIATALAGVPFVGLLAVWATGGTGTTAWPRTFTADGSALVCQRQREETHDTEWRVTLVAFDLASGEETDLLPDFDNWPWPGRAVLSPIRGDATLWFTGDEPGHCPIFRRDADGTITRLTASGAYASLCVSPDGTTLYALRSTIDSPPRVVRLDAVTADQQPAFLRAPGASTRFPTRWPKCTSRRTMVSRCAPGLLCPRVPRPSAQRR